MRLALILISVGLVQISNSQTYIKVRPGDRLVFKADTSTMYIEIVPDTVRDTVAVLRDEFLKSFLEYLTSIVEWKIETDRGMWMMQEATRTTMMRMEEKVDSLMRKQ